jgi:hypothetical protein
VTCLPTPDQVLNQKKWGPAHRQAIAMIGREVDGGVARSIARTVLGRTSMYDQSWCWDVPEDAWPDILEAFLSFVKDRKHPGGCDCGSCMRAARIARTPRHERLTEKEWRTVLERHGHQCAYCEASDVPLQREHYIPIALGGLHTAANVVPACKRCNRAKGVMPGDYYRQYLARPPETVLDCGHKVDKSKRLHAVHNCWECSHTRLCEPREHQAFIAAGAFEPVRRGGMTHREQEGTDGTTYCDSQVLQGVPGRWLVLGLWTDDEGNWCFEHGCVDESEPGYVWWQFGWDGYRVPEIVEVFTRPERFLAAIQRFGDRPGWPQPDEGPMKFLSDDAQHDAAWLAGWGAPDERARELLPRSYLSKCDLP